MDCDSYDGLLQRPFLAEHWHQGLVAALASWLPTFFGACYFFPEGVAGAVAVATTLSLGSLGAVWTQYEGFTLALSSRRYRRYRWVAGLRFGRWHPLPPIVQVRVRRVQQRHYLPVENYPVVLGVTATDRVWQVLLQVEESPVGIVAAYATQAKARGIATTLAALLQIELSVQPDPALCLTPTTP